MDIDMPFVNGIDAIREIADKSQRPTHHCGDRHGQHRKRRRACRRARTASAKPARPRPMMTWRDDVTAIAR